MPCWNTHCSLFLFSCKHLFGNLQVSAAVNTDCSGILSISISTFVCKQSLLLSFLHAQVDRKTKCLLPTAHLPTNWFDWLEGRPSGLMFVGDISRKLGIIFNFTNGLSVRVIFALWCITRNFIEITKENEMSAHTFPIE